MKYKFIKEDLEKYPVWLSCKILGVSRAGYYHWQKRKGVQRRMEEEKYLELIRKHYNLSNSRYGLLRLHKAVRREGFALNRKRIYRLMKKYNIFSITKRKFKVTTRQGKGARFSENLLNGKFQALSENQIWTSDITYLWTNEGWLYLAVILDIYSRKIIGWAIMDNVKANLVMKALSMAIVNRNPGKDIIFHSDRGTQYTSKEVRSILNLYGFRQSMSGKGNCYDNAITETFFSTLKKELVYLTEFKTRETASSSVFEYIEIFYNRQRMHSSLGYLSPVEFEMKNGEEIKSNVA